MDHLAAPLADAPILFVSLDLDAALGEPTACAGCGAEGLVPGVDMMGMSFRCPACEQTWRVELGTLVPVDVDPTVPGPRRHHS